MPASALVAFGTEAFAELAVNPFGPVHAYVAPDVKATVREMVDPSHTGLLLFGFGVAGVGLTVTDTVAGALAQPLNTTTVYVPAADDVTGVMVGF